MSCILKGLGYVVSEVGKKVKEVISEIDSMLKESQVGGSKEDMVKEDSEVRVEKQIDESKEGKVKEENQEKVVREESRVKEESQVDGSKEDTVKKDSEVGQIDESKKDMVKEDIKVKVENLENDNKEIKKTMEKLRDILKGKVINGHFVEEEVVIDVNLINEGKERMMLVDCGVPKSVISREWIEGY